MKHLIIYSFILTCLISTLQAQVVDYNNPSGTIGYYGASSSDSVPAQAVPIKASLTNALALKDIDKSSMMMSMPTSNLHPHIPNQVTPDLSKIVGQIPISEGTSPSGARTFSVPIDIVPGRNGAQPNLSITYNSQGGNGILGKGWNIGGLSAITRGSYSIYYDYKTDGYANNASDPFYLDGVRLILTTQTSTKNTYQSEQGNIKVEAFLAGSNVKYFKVWYPNGATTQMGYTNNFSNKPVYPVIEQTDKNGNIINYTYDYIDNNYLISYIDYGENGNLTHFASVHFTYVTRSDESFAWQRGVKHINKYLLDNVTCKDGSNVIRTYSFDYVVQNESLLQQIDCNINGSGLNPLHFYYGEDGLVADLDKDETQLTYWFEDIALKLKKGKFDAWSDNDGLIMYPAFNPYHLSGGHFVNMVPDNQDILIHHSLGDGLSLTQKATTEDNFVDMFSADLDAIPGDEVIKVNITEQSSNEKLQFKIYKSSAVSGLSLWKTTTVYLSKTLSSDINPKFFHTGDFNGDGKMDVFAITAKNPLGQTASSKCIVFDAINGSVKYNSYHFDYNVDFENYEENDILIPLDYNGDGKTDLCLINSTGTRVYSFITSGTSYTGLSYIATDTNLTKADIKYKRFKVGEFNGDGKADFLLSPRESYTTNYSYPISPSTPEFCYNCGTYHPVDASIYNLYNYNPLPPYLPCKNCGAQLPHEDHCFECGAQLSYNGYEYVCPYHGPSIDYTFPQYVDNGKDWKIYYNKGNGTFEENTFSFINNDRDNEYELLDMNGDGTSDLVRRNEYGQIKVYPSRDNQLSSTYIGGTQYVNKDATLIPTIISNKGYCSKLLTVHEGKAHRIAYTIEETGQKLLTGVVNSFGSVSKTRYDKMDSDNYGLYTETYGATYPYKKFNGSIYLTAETQGWNNNTLHSHFTYSYTNALLHLQGLGFRGFEQISTYDQIGYQSTTNHYDPIRFGVLTQQQTQQATVTNTYNVYVASNKIAKVNLSFKTVNDLVNGNTITTSYLYDTYGNPSKETVTYESGLTTLTDMVYSHTTTDDDYIIGLPTSKTVKNTANGHTFEEKTEWTYVNFRPETVKTFANTNKTGETIYTYDLYGNVTSKQEKAYESSKAFTTSFVYDAMHRYLTSTTNYLNQKTTIEDRNIFGQIKDEKDFLNNHTLYAYDDLGRITQITRATGEINNSSYSWDTPGSECLYVVTNTSNIDPSAKEHFDAFGRSLKKGGVGLDGLWVYTDNLYDTQGRLSQQSAPYKPGDSKLWTNYSYDTHSRPVSIVAPSGATTDYTYGNNSVTVTSQGRTSTKTTNARGDLLSATDPGGTILYDFRGDGQPNVITAPGGIQTTFTYDTYGRKTQMTDPSAGTLNYEYDSDGNVFKETNGNGVITTRYYDTYNRLKKEVTPELTTDYIYNTSGDLIGVDGSNGSSISYGYNNLHQLAGYWEGVATDANYSESYSYTNGRLTTTIYETQTLIYVLDYTYNAHNHLYCLKNQGSTVWTANSQDAYGNITRQTYGNGVTVSNSYNSFGLPTQIKSAKGTNVLQDFVYDFDPLTANLKSRSDQTRNLLETFEYDNLDRLTECTIAGSTHNTVYNVNGNIENMSGIGSYEYGVDRPYAVIGIENTANAVPAIAQHITYTSFERPATISEGGNSIAYTYNGHYDRVKNVTVKNGVTSTAYSFAGGKYRETIEGGQKKCQLFIGGSPYTAPIVIEQIGYTQYTYYLHRDYLGSITHITNQSGTVEAEYSYTAWGRLRNPANWQVYDIGQEPQLMFDRGYTGHEHLAIFGLINMNARLYDPVLGRFLSPDPVVQAPTFTQSFNRYAYCINNPLKFIDINGQTWLSNFGKWIGKNWKTIVTVGVTVVVVAVVTVATAGLGTVAAGAIIGGAGGFTSGALGSWLNGGSFLDGLGAGAINGLIGGVAGIAGGAAAGWATKSLGGVTINGVSIAGKSAIGGFVTGAIGGGVGGFVGGLGAGMILTGDFNQALSMGLNSALYGGIAGGALGGYRGFKAAKAIGRNPWTGKSLNTNKPNWNYGGHKTQTKWENQMKQRGWTEQQINEALYSGESYSASNNINPTNGATRYVHPTTGRSVVIDNVTGKILHVGGDGFLY